MSSKPLEKSPHILNTSSNLLGFCLVILTSLKITNYSEQTLIDEFTAISAMLFMVSSLLSFLSIRSENERLSYRYEKMADFIFLGALFGIFLAITMISLNIF